METDRSLAVLKALADSSRLAIVRSLMEGSQYLEEIAQRQDLAPSTVSFHLRKLVKAGLVSSRKEQYYVVFRTNDEVFNTTLREIVATHPAGEELQAARMEKYRRKVLATFFRHGRLEKLPAQHKKRLIILEQFALRLEFGRRYSEQEVTELIQPVFDDYCTVRRLLVDEGLIRRDGPWYWREGEDGDYSGILPWPSPETCGQGTRAESADRLGDKRRYKLACSDMGVYQIRNKANGRIYVGSSGNLEGTRNSRLFQLRMGKVVFSRELQKDLAEFGAENFEFSILEVLDESGQGGDRNQLLTALYLHWLEKLRPFGERGYNSAKAYQRDLKRLRTQRIMHR